MKLNFRKHEFCLEQGINILWIGSPVLKFAFDCFLGGKKDLSEE
jgi:hypothetical protein